MDTRFHKGHKGNHGVCRASLVSIVVKEKAVRQADLPHGLLDLPLPHQLSGTFSPVLATLTL